MPDNLQNTVHLKARLRPGRTVRLTFIQLDPVERFDGGCRDAALCDQSQGRAIIFEQLHPAAIHLHHLHRTIQRGIQNLIQTGGLADRRRDHVQRGQVLVAALDFCLSAFTLNDFRLQGQIGADQGGGSFLDAQFQFIVSSTQRFLGPFALGDVFGNAQQIFGVAF